jgi:hypothetical protein
MSSPKVKTSSSYPSPWEFVLVEAEPTSEVSQLV